MFTGCNMYADDLILLSPTVLGLQVMLNCCHDISFDLLLQFNCNKSTCSAVGVGSLNVIKELQLGTRNISWCSDFKYLGVSFNAGMNLTVDLSTTKRKFFCACNSIIGNTHGLDELLQLSLQESYCLPILQYATVALRLSKLQVAELNSCWNSVFRRVFGFRKFDPVREFINGLGRLDFAHLRTYLTLKFYKNAQFCQNITFKRLFVLFRHSTEFKSVCTDAGLSCDAHLTSAALARARATLSI